MVKSAFRNKCHLLKSYKFLLLSIFICLIYVWLRQLLVRSCTHRNVFRNRNIIRKQTASISVTSSLSGFTSNSTVRPTSSTTTSTIPQNANVMNPNNNNYIYQLNLCAMDFQKSLELKSFNRTLTLYETEWRYDHYLNFLFLIMENVNHPFHFLGDLTPHFTNLYSIECLYQSKTSPATFRHLNTHEYDRTVIIQCENPGIHKMNNSYVTLLFTELSTGNILQFNLSLCWNYIRRVTIGHCHKALYADWPFYLLQQWIDYHLLIGVEQFYIYDRTLKHNESLQKYIDDDQVVYIPFPLPTQVADRIKFNLIDQFIGKMHCLMRSRAAFEWLGTWDMDEYLDFYSDRPDIFLPNCSRNKRGRCSSMLSQYLAANFNDYDYVTLNGLNYFNSKNNSSTNSSSSIIFSVKTFQYRLAAWNDRGKYLIKPYYTDFITIHYGRLVSNRYYYQNNLGSLSRNISDDPKTWIHMNHYLSVIGDREQLFYQYHNGSFQYIHDIVIWKVYETLISLQR